MLTGLQSIPTTVMKPTLRALLGLAIAYVTASIVMDRTVIVPSLLSGLTPSLLLLIAGSSPLLVLLMLSSLWADRLNFSERRSLLLGAGAASVILIPLLSLVI